MLAEQKEAVTRKDRRIIQLELELKKNGIAVPPDTNLSEADLKKLEK